MSYLANQEEDIDLNPPMLYINDEEREFMLQLAPILTRSPRSMKRFVNVYRLIKVGMSELQWEVYYTQTAPRKEILAWKFRNFEVVMFLLAVITGLPTISKLFFQTFRLAQENLRTLEDILAKINVIYKNEWYIFDEPASSLPRSIKISMQAERQRLQGNLVVPDDAEEDILFGQNPNVVLNNMQIEFLNFTRWLDNWQNSEIKREDWLALNIRQIKYWDPYVSRYSFRIDPLTPED
ncbi:MAG: hypothetical protein AAF518_20315 [Spirochaetota bacterium]